jgi:hypothetical protein
MSPAAPSLPLSLLARAGRFARPSTLRRILRVSGISPPSHPAPFVPAMRRRQEALLATGAAGPHQLSTVLREERGGPIPTIVLGGFVPDATEAVYLLRDTLLHSGGLYYVNYSRRGFSSELLFAQLSDLVDELWFAHRRAPVVLGISFGAGLLLEWLRHTGPGAVRPVLRGLALISPVAGVEDLLGPDEAEPATLMGRALRPYLATGRPVDARLVELSRGIFRKLFEAGAQNREALRDLVGEAELAGLRAAVRATLAEIDCLGAAERVSSLRQLRALVAPPAALTDAPALILYAEREDAVLAERSPTRFALDPDPAGWFPNGECRVVRRHGRGRPVQHASLLFHCDEYRPVLADFYRRLKSGKVKKAA